MALKSYLCVKRDNTVWVVTFDPDAGVCELRSIMAWCAGNPPESAGREVTDWAEGNAPEIEAIYPFDHEAHTASFREDDIIEVSELMDDIRDF